MRVAAIPVIALALVGNAGAADTAAPPPPPSPPPVYTDVPINQTEIIPSDRSFNRMPVVRPKPIFFPPNPPPLGVEVSVSADAAQVGAAPSELADVINELFYASYSTRLAEREVKDDQRQEVRDYLGLKNELQEQLRQRLRDLRDVDAAARLRGLESFSAVQTPKLVELEKNAERLRGEFLSHGWTSDGSGNWYGLRDWKLGRGELAKPREEIALFEYQVMRAAAYYQEKLLPAERRLLREIAMEMEENLFHADDEAVAGAATDPAQARPQSPFMFFSPDTARVTFPDDLPPALRDEIDAYRREKDAIKRELRDTIYECDRSFFTSGRNRACEQLAREQEPRIAALEAAAERIRRDLVRVPAFERMTPVTLPPEALKTDIEKYLAEKSAFVSGLTQHVHAAGAKSRSPDSTDPADVRAWIAERKRMVQEATQQYRQENADRVARMDALLERLRDGIEKFDAASPTSSIGSLDDRFLADFLASIQRKQSAYDYWAAVFEPGLSPEQRRLLYDGAIVMLGLPLPGPEKQPTSLPGTILR